MKENVFILSKARTPIGSFGGALSTITATALGSIAVKGAIDRSKVPVNEVDELIMGNVISANLGQAPARQVALQAGLNPGTTCTTINKVCASGMKSVMYGAQSIMLGSAQVVVAGGMENMSQIPFYIPKARYGYGYGNGVLVDGLVRDGLTDVYDQVAMGVFGDKTGAKYEITREQQDAFAINSYKRSAVATDSRFFKNEIVSVEVADRKGITVVEEDEEFKKVNFDKIPLLKPVFSKEGTVTAANASTINDGAAALVLASELYVNTSNLRPIARIVAFADAEQAPQWFTTTPGLATRKVLKAAGLTIDQIDYFEVNEAFAVVVLAFMKEFQLEPEKINVFGGAVSLGHPLGASGARIITTLLSVLEQKQGRYGLAAICNGGGGASAIIIEKL